MIYRTLGTDLKVSDIVTPLIVSNTDDYSEIVSLANGQVKAMTPVLEAK